MIEPADVPQSHLPEQFVDHGQVEAKQIVSDQDQLVGFGFGSDARHPCHELDQGTMWGDPLCVSERVGDVCLLDDVWRYGFGARDQRAELTSVFWDVGVVCICPDLGHLISIEHGHARRFQVESDVDASDLGFGFEQGMHVTSKDGRSNYLCVNKTKKKKKKNMMCPVKSW